MKRFLALFLLLAFIVTLGIGTTACSKSSNAEKFVGTWEDPGGIREQQDLL